MRFCRQRKILASKSIKLANQKVFSSISLAKVRYIWRRSDLEASKAGVEHCLDWKKGKKIVKSGVAHWCARFNCWDKRRKCWRKWLRIAPRKSLRCRSIWTFYSNKCQVKLSKLPIVRKETKHCVSHPQASLRITLNLIRSVCRSENSLTSRIWLTK